MRTQSRVDWLGIFWISCGLLAGIAVLPVSAQTPDVPPQAAVERAAGNRGEIVAAWQRIPAEQREGLEFLLRHMPDQDLQQLSADFLVENVDYAYRAWQAAPWKENLPKDVFLNDVLPYANINERRDRWRKDFYERFQPLVADVTSPGQAAARLNQKLFSLVNVRYSTKRPKADQSPYESIEAGLASCTGLSILLIDACRAVGVPARFVGTPLWSDRSGNHSWVEVWDDGWHFTGAAEPTGDELDKAWFVDRASRAQTDDPRHAIYAVSFRTTPLRFPLVWDRRLDYVRAVNVTPRYLGKAQELPAGYTEVMFRVLNGATQDRCAANFRIRDPEGKIIYQGQTKDERFDANDHLTVPLAQGQVYEVEVSHNEQVTRQRLDTSQPQALVTIRVDTEVKSEAEDEAEGDDKTEVEAQTDDTSNDEADLRATQGLAEYLQIADEERPPLEAEAFASMPLSREEAQRAQELLWQDHVLRIRATRADEIKRRSVQYETLKMPFDYKVSGEKPAGGRSLYISLHGGGNTAARVNDRQWENQKGLYEPDEGVYLAPRAPTDTWDLWHQAHIDPFFDRLIEDLIVIEDVNPNRVYLLGYSAGGDGVYQVAPRFADRLAAASMMAGHPNESSPLGLRNLPFSLHMGGEDAAYNRNRVAAEWGAKLDQLQTDDPEGYPHWVKIYPGKAHWMDHEDAAAIPWMAKFTRNPFPSKVVWMQDDVTHDRFYWLAVAPAHKRARTLVTATLKGRQIDVQSDDVPQVLVRLNDTMLSLDEPLTIAFNGRKVFEGKVVRTIQTLARTLAERGDPASVFSAEVTVARDE